MSDIWCQNIQAFLGYSSFCVGIFYFASPCVCSIFYTQTMKPFVVLYMTRKSYSRSSTVSSFIRSPGISIRDQKIMLRLFWDKNIWNDVEGRSRPLAMAQFSSPHIILLVVYSSHVSILYHFSDVQRQIMAYLWNIR